MRKVLIVVHFKAVASSSGKIPTNGKENGKRKLVNSTFKKGVKAVKKETVSLFTAKDFAERENCHVFRDVNSEYSGC